MRTVGRLALLSLLVAVTAARCSGQTSGGQPSFTLTIRVDQNTFKVGSKIELQIALANTSNRSLAVWKENGEPSAELDGFGIVVQDGNGASAHETKYGRAVTGKEESTEGRVSSGVGGSLPPGETFKDATVLNKLFDLSEAGKYKVQVLRTDPASKAAVKSNTITITVIP